MRFFLDENFPKAAVGLLEDMGREVFDLRGSGREGLPDPDIFAEAQRCAAVFLTTDRDFFHTIPHLHEKHAGIIVIALRQPNRSATHLGSQSLCWNHSDVHPQRINIKVDTCNFPRGLQPEQLGVVIRGQVHA